MSLLNAENKFLEIIKEIKDESDKIRFLHWININWKINELPVEKSKEFKILDKIADELRSELPDDAILPTENIVMPLRGPNSDCTSANSVHVDEFLFDDDYVENLVEEGKLSRYYCNNCGSKNVKPLKFITHSMSAEKIEFLFTSVLPPLDDKIILDVGSRLGAVLYGAYLYTKSSKIIGVEINKEFCKLQNNIIQKYGYFDRVEIICNDIFSETEMLSSADVIVLNNVFEFFANVDATISSWWKLAENIKIGAIIVTIPRLESTFSQIPIGFNWEEWVEELPLYNDKVAVNNFENHLEQMQHYRVKQKMTR